MKKFNVKIKGLSPYMQHRMDDKKLEDWINTHHDIFQLPGVPAEDAARAEFHCYRNGNKKCFIPSEQIRGSLINAGSYVKSKVGSTTKSMKGIVAAMFMISPEHIELPDYDVIDKRSAVNKNVKARVITVRPKWSTWSVEFELHVDNDNITKEMVEKLFDYAGRYVGIGSYRPTNNGMFGRFEVERINLKN